MSTLVDGITKSRILECMASKKGSGDKIAIKPRALLARINRQLAKTNQKMLLGRAVNASKDAYFIVDEEKETVSESNVDPEKWARQNGLLKGYEVLVDEDA